MRFMCQFPRYITNIHVLHRYVLYIYYTDYYGDHDCMIGDGPELSAQGINNLHRMEQMLANGDGPAQQNGGQNGDTDQQG